MKTKLARRGFIATALAITGCAAVPSISKPTSKKERKDESRTAKIFVYDSPAVAEGYESTGKPILHSIYNLLLTRMGTEYSGLPLRFRNSNPEEERLAAELIAKQEGRLQRPELERIARDTNFVFLFEVTHSRHNDTTEAYHAYNVDSTMLRKSDGSIVHKGSTLTQNLAYSTDNASPIGPSTMAITNLFLSRESMEAILRS